MLITLAWPQHFTETRQDVYCNKRQKLRTRHVSWFPYILISSEFGVSYGMPALKDFSWCTFGSACCMIFLLLLNSFSLTAVWVDILGLHQTSQPQAMAHIELQVILSMVVRNYNHGQLGNCPSKNCIHPFHRTQVFQLKSPRPPLVTPSFSTFDYLHHISQYLLWFSWIFIVNEESRIACILDVSCLGL